MVGGGPKVPPGCAPGGGRGEWNSGGSRGGAFGGEGKVRSQVAALDSNLGGGFGGRGGGSSGGERGGANGDKGKAVEDGSLGGALWGEMVEREERGTPVKEEGGRGVGRTSLRSATREKGGSGVPLEHGGLVQNEGEADTEMGTDGDVERNSILVALQATRQEDGTQVVTTQVEGVLEMETEAGEGSGSREHRNGVAQADLEPTVQRSPRQLTFAATKQIIADIRTRASPSADAAAALADSATNLQQEMEMDGLLRHNKEVGGNNRTPISKPGYVQNLFGVAGHAPVIGDDRNVLEEGEMLPQILRE